MKTIAFVRASKVYDDSRSTKEINTMLEAGYKVVVLGWDRDGHSILRCKEVFSDYSDNITFFFYNRQLNNGIGIKNIPKFLGWIIWVIRKLKKQNVDYVHACDFDAGFPSLIFSKIKKKILVYDIFDYYIDSHSIPKCISNIVEKSEISVINYAFTTIICTEERHEQIKKASPKKTVVIHNTPDIKKEYLNTVDTSVDYFYCGGLDERRLIKEIIEDYKQNDDLTMVMAGYGKYAALAKSYSDTYKNFDFLGNITYANVIEKERHAAVLSAIYEPTIRNHKLCAPNKFYEALALGKPIIVCKGTGIDKIVDNEKIGISIDYNAKQFYSAVRKILQAPDEAIEMGKRGRLLYEQKYSWYIMKKRLIDMYKEIDQFIAERGEK